MLDLGWTEILVIGVVALIVIGPKDLPRMLRTLGQYAGRARGIAREFQRSMDDAARQADIDELKEVKKGLDDMRDAQYKMQREMGQSFLDKSKKDEPKAGGAKSAGKPAGKPADKPADKPAGKPAVKPAAKTDAKPAVEPAQAPAPATPAPAGPGKTSGA